MSQDPVLLVRKKISLQTGKEEREVDIARIAVQPTRAELVVDGLGGLGREGEVGSNGILAVGGEHQFFFSFLWEKRTRPNEPEGTGTSASVAGGDGEVTSEAV